MTGRSASAMGVGLPFRLYPDPKQKEVCDYMLIEEAFSSDGRESVERAGSETDANTLIEYLDDYVQQTYQDLSTEQRSAILDFAATCFIAGQTFQAANEDEPLIDISLDHTQASVLLRVLLGDER